VEKLKKVISAINTQITLVMVSKIKRPFYNNDSLQLRKCHPLNYFPEPTAQRNVQKLVVAKVSPSVMPIFLLLRS
jgi:hypothetical protein